MIFLNGMQKSALLLISMDVKESMRILKYFTESEIHAFIEFILSSDINFIKYSNIIIHDCCIFLKEKNLYSSEFKRYILNIFKKTIDIAAFKKLFRKSIIKKSLVHNFSLLNTLSARNIFLLVQKENLHIIAALLVYLNKKISTRILSYFDKKKRLDLCIQIKNFSSLNKMGILELNKIIYRTLFQYICCSFKEQIINKIIYFLYFLKKKKIFYFINKINLLYPHLINKIISKYFKFQDLIYIDNKSIQFIIKNIDMHQLCIVLHTTSYHIKEKFIVNMSNIEYQFFQNSVNLIKKLSIEDIYLNKNLLLTRIKHLIRDNKLVIEKK